MRSALRDGSRACLRCAGDEARVLSDDSMLITVTIAGGSARATFAGVEVKAWFAGRDLRVLIPRELIAKALAGRTMAQRLDRGEDPADE